MGFIQDIGEKDAVFSCRTDHKGPELLAVLVLQRSGCFLDSTPPMGACIHEFDLIIPYQKERRRG